MLKIAMKQFEPTLDKTFTFSSCEICEAKCCNGKQGTLFSQIILEDFEKIYKNFPILFIFGELGYLKPVVILTNGKDYCKYQKDFKCSIYENRPSICRTYPLSANIDEMIYIDVLCPAVNSDENSENIISKQQINSSFDFSSLHNYQDKYIDTFRLFEEFNNKEDFQAVIELSGVVFFKYTKNSKDKYMKMHQESLVHLQDKYFMSLN